MNRVERRIVFSIASLPLALMTIGGTVAQAQDAATEEIVVVGTRGDARSPLESAVPVDLISADEIASAHSFGGELGELLQALAPSFSFPRQSNSGLGDHVRAAQLRGMSPDHVLVLVNGKRQHTASVVSLETKIGLGTNPFDFNTIPLIAIERIEILRDGAGAQYGSDAIAGVINIVLKDAPTGGSVIASFGQHRTDFDPVDDDIDDGDTWSVAADYGFEIGEGGSLRVGGEYRTRDETNRAGIGVLPFFEDQTPANLALDPARVFQPGDGGADDVYLFYNARIPVGEKEFYSFGRYSHRDTDGTGFFRYPDGFTSLPSVHPDGFRPITTGENTDTSFTLGFRGSGEKIDWDLSMTIGENEFESGVENSANPSLGPTSPTTFDLGDFEFKQITINADAVREFDLGNLSSPLSFAYGAEFRLENYETTAGDPASYEAGPFIAGVGAQAGPGLPADRVADVDRTVFAAYVDVEADLTDRFSTGAAVRYEDYDDFGDKWTGKLSARFEVTDSFAIRGAAGTNFRAPSLAQTGYERATTNFGSGGMLEVFRLLPVTDPDAIAEGALPLQEEESTNLSIGFVYEYGPEFSLTADYFQIDVDDRITLVNAGNNIQYFTNLIDTETDGFDIVASGVFDVGNGMIDWRVSYNNSETDAENPSVLGVEDLNTVETASPDDKIIVSGNWTVDRWSTLLRVTRFGETTRVFDFGGGFEPTQTYDSVWSLDAEFAAKIGEAWTVAIGADNLTDEYPDRSIDDISYFGHLPYDVLSGIGMNGRYIYLRTQFDY